MIYNDGDNDVLCSCLMVGSGMYIAYIQQLLTLSR